MNSESIQLSLKILINHLLKGKPSYHKDYDRVVYLADLYKKLITGNNIESLLTRYNPRESKDQFEQRLRITQLVTPAVCEKIKTPFFKVARIDNVKNNITFQDADKEKNDELKAAIELCKTEYFGEETMDQFMESIYIDESFSDPNAFLLVEFDGKIELNGDVAKPFPVIVSSEDAISFKYVNNELQYLVVKYNFKLKTKKGYVDAIELRMYTGDYIIKITEIDQDEDFVEQNVNLGDLMSTKRSIITVKKKKYEVRLIEQGSNGYVQAVRIGYKRDEVSGKRTYVSPMHSAIPRMMKSIKATSEMDLTMTLHVFPQKAQYAPKCPGKKGVSCSNGVTISGTCTVCKGSGFGAVTSSQEMLTLPLPREASDIIDLSKMVVYNAPPVELAKFMAEFQLQLEVQSMQDVFTSESFNRIVAPKTLGEKELDMESVYDTLYPFSTKYSSVYKKQIKLIAVFTDKGQGINVTHEFPKDFKLKTAKALIADRSSAVTAQLPSDLLNEIDNDIAIKLFANNPSRLNEYQIKQQHIPFKGKTDSQIQISINMGLATEFHKILWSNFDAIFEEIESDFLKNSINFYELPYDQRVDEVKKKTEEYIELINSSNSSSTLFPTILPEEEEPTEE